MGMCVFLIIFKPIFFNFKNLGLHGARATLAISALLVYTIYPAHLVYYRNKLK